MVLRLTPRGRRFASAAVLALVIGLITTITIATSSARKPPAGPAAAAPVAAAPPKYVLLTFDDGPDPKYTPQILDILEAYDAKATFFEVGREIGRHPELTLRIHQLGHSVQNHTWTHADLRGLSWMTFKDQIQSTDEAIRAQTGYTPRCLRPPYGSVDAVVTKRATSLGKELVLWKIDSRDWTRPGTTEIVRRALTGVQNGSTILFHDGGGNRSQTVAALPLILKTLKSKGYTFQSTHC
ncbi:MAG TPA: polysaccharide deacetylase family protein [Kribbella sp.]|uniref:polysaccharide deacetylase family protein n=1 Tax=Kribbella sp. TaxID=1871183 RepID=UPI002D7746A2|nr:polysaccharide deacetylase family protein [Kribbella sp.]HET6295455.1 polysaccharide deacetylase family protein [Kribbella sp.]